MNISVFLTVAFDPTKKMEFAEALPYGLKTALLGMGVIFAVLIILLVVLSLFKVIFYKPAGEKKEAPLVAPTPAPVASAPVTALSDDAELVAAITAAIASMIDKPATSFRVVSFRRTASK